MPTQEEMTRALYERFVAPVKSQEVRKETDEQMKRRFMAEIEMDLVTRNRRKLKINS